MADNPAGTEGAALPPQLRQLRDALERAIVSSLQLLDQLEAELGTVQTQEDIAQRKSRASALIDVKKVRPPKPVVVLCSVHAHRSRLARHGSLPGAQILEPLPLAQKPDVPLDTVRCA